MGELDFVTKLFEKIIKAGFGHCPHSYYEIINRLNGMCPNPENNLRMFYLMYCGLASATIRIPDGEFDMLGQYHDHDISYSFEKDIYGPYEVSRGVFDHYINLRKIKLHKFTDYLFDGNKGRVEDVLIGLKKKIFQRLGCVWHAQWLYRHQEFIPKSWSKVLESGGYIIFPGTELVDEENGPVRYAVLNTHWNRKVLELCFYDEGSLNTDKTNHFIATVGPNREKTFFKKSRGLIKTRRYHNK